VLKGPAVLFADLLSYLTVTNIAKKSSGVESDERVVKPLPITGAVTADTTTRRH
jgi:hypothetical protein